MKPFDSAPIGPVYPPKQGSDWRSFALALLAHGLLVLFLVIGLNWKTSADSSQSAEAPSESATDNSQFIPVELEQSEQKTELPVKPQISKPSPPPPPPPAVTPAPEPKPTIDPDIAFEEERKKRAEQERVQLEKEAAERKAKEDAAKEQQRIKQEREKAEKQERDRLEQQRKDAERLEREKQEKQEKEEEAKKAEVLKKQEAAKKAAAEKKLKEEEAKKVKEAAEAKAKAEAEKKAEADKKAKAEAEKKAKADAAKKAAADQALKDALRKDALGVGGLAGGTSGRNQAAGSGSGSGGDDGYGAKIRACVQPGVQFPVPPRSTANPRAEYRVDLRPDGTISAVKLTRSSGNPNFDRAVETGIRRCSPFPAPPSGKYPGYINVNYNMYD